MSRHTCAPALALLALSIACACHVQAATPTEPFERPLGEALTEEVWTANGGELKLRFNTDFLALYGIEVSGVEPAPGQHLEDEDLAVFRIHGRDGLQLNAPEGGFDRFVGGSVEAEGGLRIALPDATSLNYERIRVATTSRNGAELELIGDDGQAWFYVNHLMYKMIDDHRVFYIRSADVRATSQLAERLGVPELANAFVGELRMSANIVARPAGFDVSFARCPNPNFHGTPVAGGGTHRADVLMEAFDFQFSRCRRGDTQANGCDGAGPDNGEVVFTPNSTLRNSNNLDTADVPWFSKFSTSPYDFPYQGNDQHPYLIWNMFRITDGQLQQIGASGLKHAFLTINTGCAPGACTGSGIPGAAGHILGKNCGDVYGAGTNDGNNSLGPRHELVPSTGYWGRCGSIYDTNCDGASNSSGNTNYSQRMVVRESQMQVPGSQFYAESWYIVQDDVNIYNTMAHRTMSPAASGSAWIPGSQGSFTLGPVINTWVNPTANPTHNIEIDDPRGHTRVAVKVKTLASCPDGSGLTGTCYRYDYAVNNFDFSNPTYGTPPNNAPPNLRVTSNLGFDRFSLPVGNGAVFVDPANNFADIDIDAGNNWSAAVEGGHVTWTAPAGNELNWGLLFRFSVVTNAAPDNGRTANVELRVAGESESLSGALMVPSINEPIFVDGFELP